MPCRVGIVEDDSILRSTLTQLLDADESVSVVSSSATGGGVLELASQKAIDVALLDIHLGDGPTGLDIASSLRQEMPSVGIVFLSSVKDPRLLGYRPTTLPRGARYILKSDISDASKLIEHIHAVAEGLSAANVEKPPRIPFTETQIDILRLVAAGYSNDEIAKERFVTEGAVEVAVSRLAKHLGLRDSPGGNRRVHIALTFFREMGWPT